jgi:hypothetical protein
MDEEIDFRFFHNRVVGGKEESWLLKRTRARVYSMQKECCMERGA